MWMSLSRIITFVFLTMEVTAQDKRRHRNKGKAMGGNLGPNRNVDYTTETSVGLRRQQTGFRIWTLDTYPNPQTEPTLCGRHGYRSFLCDPDGVLTRNEGNNHYTKI
ncbi:hypothetical protein LSH36_880g01000 [Paralvinella palmiformis]|uniref:Uncharacterized protein n=1 Tax=Paralvinella palmiformis TaxID=53620 RepID=A0AAD9MT13_9ANNE|nr:hypothetical protein LSH36_880g01000 [Paralvinella palmiformis]